MRAAVRGDDGRPRAGPTAGGCRPGRAGGCGRQLWEDTGTKHQALQVPCTAAWEAPSRSPAPQQPHPDAPVQHHRLEAKVSGRGSGLYQQRRHLNAAQRLAHRRRPALGLGVRQRQRGPAPGRGCGCFRLGGRQVSGEERKRPGGPALGRHHPACGGTGEQARQPTSSERLRRILGKRRLPSLHPTSSSQHTCTPTPNQLRRRAGAASQPPHCTLPPTVVHGQQAPAGAVGRGDPADCAAGQVDRQHRLQAAGRVQGTRAVSQGLIAAGRHAGLHGAVACSLACLLARSPACLLARRSPPRQTPARPPTCATGWSAAACGRQAGRAGRAGRCSRGRGTPRGRRGTRPRPQLQAAGRRGVGCVGEASQQGAT